MEKSCHSLKISKLRVLKKFRTFVFYGKTVLIFVSTQREIRRFSFPGVIAMHFIGHWKIIVKIFRE